MPLRKKHIRRIVVAMLAVGVLGPLVILAFYVAHLRSGAYGRALEEELASRLRCEARVVGARPTGVATAAADAVDLAWTVGEGQLALRLEAIRAERNTFGWYVTAGEGSLRLTGSAPWDTLAALNQRLVQPDATRRLMAVNVNRLRLDLDLESLAVVHTTRAGASSNGRSFAVHLLSADAGAVPSRGPSDEADWRPAASLRLDPASDRGMFDGLRVEARDVPLGAVRRMLKVGGSPPPARGTADVNIAWNWAEPRANAPRTANVQVNVHKMDLSEWTKGIAGGPITGTAELAVTYAKGCQGVPATEVVLKSGAGTLNDETLRWLAGLPAGMAAAGPISAKTIAFDRLSLRCRIVGDRGQFEGPRDATGAIPLVTCRLFGVDVPILKASARTFDAGALWAALKPVLAPPAEKK